MQSTKSGEISKRTQLIHEQQRIDAEGSASITTSGEAGEVEKLEPCPWCRAVPYHKDEPRTYLYIDHEDSCFLMKQRDNLRTLHKSILPDWNARVPLAPEQQWQPISSAPKGEKLIVAYRNPLGKWRRVMATYWIEGTLEGEIDDSGFAPEGWYEATEAYEYLMPLEEEPTLWTFPPAAPGQQPAQPQIESGKG